MVNECSIISSKSDFDQQDINMNNIDNEMQTPKINTKNLELNKKVDPPNKIVENLPDDDSSVKSTTQKKVRYVRKYKCKSPYIAMHTSINIDNDPK